jgi:hypothetical protein
VSSRACNADEAERRKEEKRAEIESSRTKTADGRELKE